MTDSEIRPIRKISNWKVFGIFCLVSFLIFVAVVFIPWDVPPARAPDLKAKTLQPPPEENAFVWFEKASQDLVDKFPAAPDGSERHWGLLTVKIGDEGEKWDPAFAAEVLAANAPLFSDVDKGLACRLYASPTTESFEERLPWLQKYAPLIRLLGLKSKHAQLTGDPAGAVKPALQMLRLSQMFVEGSNGLVEWEGGTAFELAALQRLEELVADARTPDPVQAEILGSLNQWDPEAVAEGYRNAMRAEYPLTIQRIKDVINGKNPDPLDIPGGLAIARFVPYVCKANIMSRELAIFYRHQIECASLPRTRIPKDYPGNPECPERMLPQLWVLVKPNSFGIVYFPSIVSHPKSVLEEKYSLQANIAALRLKIALRLYEKRHGQLPDDLKALVPEFIQGVPTDPLDDKSFRYSKDKRRVWSVGRDGIDNGGAAYEGRPMTKRSNYDLVMPLGTREMVPNVKGADKTKTSFGVR